MADKSKKSANIVMPKKLVTAAAAQTPASAAEKNSALPTDNFTALNQSVQTLRAMDKVPEALRQLVSFEGTASAAMFDYVEAAHTSYSIVAYNPVTHEMDPEGTRMALTIVNNMNTLNDYSEGYADTQAMDQIVETSLLEVVTTGGLANELVLDKTRLPVAINVVSYDTLEAKSNGKGGRYWVQAGTKGEINLNIATFFVAELHKFASKGRARSMMEPAINSAWYYSEFMEDMRRAVKNQHGRLKVSLVTDKIVATAPADVRADPVKLLDYLETVREGVSRAISSASPEDALVVYDTAVLDMLKSVGEKSDYVTLLQNISGNLATSLKVSPSIVGLRMEGSQSLTNTESLLFIKSARGIQKPVETNLSRALTLAVRLHGLDCYVEFRFDPIDLRPENELEAFRTMKQSRILELLSLGLISDEDAALQLGIWAIPAGTPKLSGTGFEAKKGPDASKASPNDDPQGAALQPKTPKKGGGRSQ